MDGERSQSIRLSAKEMVILQLLVECGDSYGLQLVRASGGQLTQGMLYTTLNRMVCKGLLTSRSGEQPTGPNGPVRRLYSVTAYGARLLNLQESFEREFALLPQVAK